MSENTKAVQSIRSNRHLKLVLFVLNKYLWVLRYDITKEYKSKVSTK